MAKFGPQDASPSHTPETCYPPEPAPLSNWHVSRFAYLSLLPGPQQHVITGSNWWKTTCFTSLVVCENTFLLYLRHFTWWQLTLILGGKLIDMNDGCNLDLDWIICFETNWERNHILNELSPPFSFIFSWNFWPPLCFPFIPIHWTLPVSLCTICRWRWQSWRRPWGYLRWCCCCCHRRRWWWSQALLPAIVAKSVKISTNQFLSQKNSTKNARFTTFLNTRQNSVNAFEIS